MEPIRIYTSSYCSDCWNTKTFLRERGVSFEEINVDEDPEAEELIIRMNNGLRKVPTIETGGRYFSCSPFDAELLAAELHIPLNP
jgi:mycoredoxin